MVFPSFLGKLEIDSCEHLSFSLPSIFPPQSWESWLRENLQAFRETWLWITSSPWPRPWTFWAAGPLWLNIAQIPIKTCLYTALFHGRKKALLPFGPATMSVTWAPSPTPNPHDRAHLWPRTSSRKTHCKTGKGKPSPSGNFLAFYEWQIFVQRALCSMYVKLYESLLPFLPSSFLPVLEEPGPLYVRQVLYPWTASLAQVNSVTSIKLSLPLAITNWYSQSCFAFISPSPLLCYYWSKSHFLIDLLYLHIFLYMPF